MTLTGGSEISEALGPPPWCFSQMPVVRASETLNYSLWEWIVIMSLS